MSTEIWLILLLFIFIFLANRRVKEYLYLKRIENACKNEFDEAKIVAHLNEVIWHSLSQYILFNLSPQASTKVYIDTETQKNITEYLIDTIPERLSSTLRDKLSLICSEDSLGSYIAENIYIIVQDYVLKYNTDQEIQ